MDKLHELLKSKGLTAKDLERLLQPKPVKVKVVKKRTTKKYKFGVVSDTHLCDKACALSELHDFYKRCEKEGIKEVVHAGDVTAGSGKIFPGQLNELTVFGFDEQLKYVCENYPKFKGKTYFINGNHCLSFKVDAGANFGQHLAQMRSDMIYLGDYDATVVLNGVKIGLHHGAGNTNSYAISYKAQKYVEKIGAGQKPQIYILGHYHCTLQMFYRNIHVFLPACFQRPTDFSVRLGLPNTVGGWIVELEVADDRFHTIKSIKSEYIAYY